MFKILHIPTAKYACWYSYELDVSSVDSSYFKDHLEYILSDLYYAHTEHSDCVRLYFKHGRARIGNVYEFEIVEVDGV